MISLLGAAVGGLPAWAWRVLGYGLLAVSLFVFGYVEGVDHDSKELAQQVAKEATAATALITRQEQIAGPVVERYITLTKTIHDQVQGNNDAITRDVPRGMVLSYSWRLHHDAAATGSVPDATSRVDGPGVDAQDALDTVAGNYGSARLNEAQLDALEEWVCKQWKLTHKGEQPSFNCPGGSP